MLQKITPLIINLGQSKSNTDIELHVKIWVLNGNIVLGMYLQREQSQQWKKEKRKII